MKRANSCRDCGIEAFRQRGGKSRVPKAGAQVADLRRAGWLVRVQEGKQRRHREESGAGAEARS